jgi:hypothetical protein
MDLRVGERVVAESESTERPPHRGKIEEVLGPSRYRIRWDDGHESIYAPAAGALQRDRETTGPSEGRSAD